MFRIELFDCAPMEICVGGDYYRWGGCCHPRWARRNCEPAARLNFPSNALTTRTRYGPGAQYAIHGN
jgi:hypothetical protein